MSENVKYFILICLFVIISLGNCHGVWFSGCDRFGSCRLLCTQNQRKDMALWKTQHLLGGASCWWKGLRGQRCRRMGKRKENHRLIRLALRWICKENSGFDLNWPSVVFKACSQMNSQPSLTVVKSGSQWDYIQSWKMLMKQIWWDDELFNYGGISCREQTCIFPY